MPPISNPSAGLARIIEKEQPDALLPTMGGQTASIQHLHLKAGVHEKFNVEMIGARADVLIVLKIAETVIQWIKLAKS